MLTFDQKYLPAVAGFELRHRENVVTVLRPDDAGEGAFLSQMGGLEVHPEGEPMRSAQDPRLRFLQDGFRSKIRLDRVRGATDFMNRNRPLQRRDL
jgi:hypothetical protein